MKPTTKSLEVPLTLGIEDIERIEKFAHIIAPSLGEDELLALCSMARASLAQSPKVEESERCKHDIHGTDCFECYPTEAQSPVSDQEKEIFQDYADALAGHSRTKPLSESELDAKFDELWKSETWDDDRAVFKAGYRLAVGENK